MKVIKTTVGWRVETPDKTYYVGEYSYQGVVYKDDNAYDSGCGVCYIPEYDFDNSEQNMYELFDLSDKHIVADHIEDNPYIATTGYTRKDFENIVADSQVDAHDLYLMVDWQSPETLLNELEY